MSTFSVIFPAAGTGSRFGGNKLVAELIHQPVILRAINAFLPREDVTEIIIATDHRQAIEDAVAKLAHADFFLQDTRIKWCPGGPTRAHTVRNAAEMADGDWIAIHDAARPLVSQSLIDRVFDAALTHGAAAPAMPVSLTIKEASTTLPSPIIRTVPRNRLWAMQTPQVMRRADLLDAYNTCSIALEEMTDDVQLLEKTGKPVMLVGGEERNLKITTPLDLQLAELLLRSDDGSED